MKLKIKNPFEKIQQKIQQQKQKEKETPQPTTAPTTKTETEILQSQIIELKKQLEEKPKEIIIEKTIEQKTQEPQTPPEYKQLQEKFKQCGLEFNPELLNTSFVSLPGDNKNDKMFEEFLKILLEFMKDENSFKTGRLDKSGTQNFPISVCETIKLKQQIIEQAHKQHIKPRYIIHEHFIKNFHIANSIQDIKDKQSKAEFYRDMATAFTQYKSWLSINEAKHTIPEEETGQPSEKMRRGILGR